jgi:hypothetical protein
MHVYIITPLYACISSQVVQVHYEALKVDDLKERVHRIASNKALFPSLCEMIPLSWRILIEELDKMKIAPSVPSLMSVTHLWSTHHDDALYFVSRRINYISSILS